MSDLPAAAEPPFHHLPPAEFARGLRQPGALLLDVRRPDEFAAGHLPGARNLDVTAPDFARRAATLPRTQPLYLYCRSGIRSATAAGQLAAAGFGPVHHLVGGVLDWPEPLVR